MTDHTTRPHDLPPEGACSSKVSYMTSAGHLMLVFRERACEDGCDADDFLFGWCQHGHRGEMEPAEAIRVLDEHARTALSADELMARLDECGVRHENGRLPHSAVAA